MIREPSIEGRPEQGRGRDYDIVEIGRFTPGSGAEALDLRESDLAKPVRRETLARATQHPSDRRDRTRLLTALLILELGFLGALYMGRRYADAQVIVVPTPANERSVIT